MKKYLIFKYENHYPSGGFSDYVDSFDVFDEVVPYILTDLVKKEESGYYIQILNTSTLYKIILYMNGNNISSIDLSNSPETFSKEIELDEETTIYHLTKSIEILIK